MNLLSTELEQQGYVVIEKLGHDDIIPFVKKYLRKKTLSAMLYYAANVLIALGIVAKFFIDFTTPGFTIGQAANHISYGLAIAFGLVPLHEYIHVLAYKSQGAKNTSYDANLKKFYFMAMADQFVANRKEFRVVALAPFVVISGILLLVLPFSGQLWSYAILGTLLTHTAFTSGDFGLLSFFDFYKNRNIVSYDDKAGRISYFLEKQDI